MRFLPVKEIAITLLARGRQRRTRSRLGGALGSRPVPATTQARTTQARPPAAARPIAVSAQTPKPGVRDASRPGFAGLRRRRGRTRSRPPFGKKLAAGLPYFDRGAGVFKLLLDLFCFFLVNPLFNRLGGRLDKILGLLEPEARNRADFLDHIDLLVADGGQNNVEFGLFGGGPGRRHRHRRGRRDTPFFLEHLRQLSRLEHAQRRQLLNQTRKIRHFLLLVSQLPGKPQSWSAAAAFAGANRRRRLRHAPPAPAPPARPAPAAPPPAWPPARPINRSACRAIRRASAGSPIP